LSSDDVAISEAIAEVEKELEDEEDGKNPSIWETNLDIGKEAEDDVDNREISPGDNLSIQIQPHFKFFFSLS
jgi:hypothetical protein